MAQEPLRSELSGPIEFGDENFGIHGLNNFDDDEGRSDDNLELPRRDARF